MALVQISKALAQTSIQAQQQPQQVQQQVGGGRGAGHTDMPCYAYCFDRGNGQYTRLIPADMLPALVDIPALQQGCLGMQILPCPTGLAPTGRSSNLERVFVQPTQQYGGQLTRRDPVQSRIDTIVASIPAPEPHKRQKIYCDKWIHEGVCAFTQQGCKYKHEMPLDKDTQESLGLFQGLPIWWRKHQGEITSDSLTSQQQMDGPPPLSNPAVGGGAGLAGRSRGYSAGAGRGGFGGANRLRNNTWRSQAPAQGQGQGPVQGRGPSASVSSGSGVAVGGGGSGQVGGQRPQGLVANFSCQYGPIAPPSVAAKHNFEKAHNATPTRPARNPYVDNNMWNVLHNEQSGNTDSEEGAKLG
ncbi:hypothetical protein GE09DRAFT_1058973 [Coniochaeta sp. 2T2.1]|nr:hypothetical protein GE09DRAFT_1058973 [Coniochaeta sp. 2T2.1]